MGSANYEESGELVVGEDQFYVLGFETDGSASVDVEVQVISGPRVDVFMLDSANLAQMQDGRHFLYQISCSREDVSFASYSCNLPGGNWRLVIDNTSAGRAAPPANFVDDGARVKWSMSVAG